MVIGKVRKEEGGRIRKGVRDRDERKRKR